MVGTLRFAAPYKNVEDLFLEQPLLFRILPRRFLALHGYFQIANHVGTTTLFISCVL